MNLKTMALAAVCGKAALVGLGWAGLQVRPRRQPTSDYKRLINSTMPIPEHWPVPVRKHYEMCYGVQVPVVNTAVIHGWARIHMGLWLPMRFSAYHQLGQNFVREMALTWFRLPFMSGEDWYVDGHGLMDIGGKHTKGYEIDQAENMVMWSEALLFPSALDGRVRWEQTAENEVRLIMPFGFVEDSATLTFDPITHYLRRFSALRFKQAGEERRRWHVDYLNWRAFGGFRMPEMVRVTWEDDDDPWFIGHIDHVGLNEPVPDKIRLRENDTERWLFDEAEVARAKVPA